MFSLEVFEIQHKKEESELKKNLHNKFLVDEIWESAQEKYWEADTPENLLDECFTRETLIAVVGLFYPMHQKDVAVHCVHRISHKFLGGATGCVPDLQRFIQVDLKRNVVHEEIFFIRIAFIRIKRLKVVNI